MVHNSPPLKILRTLAYRRVSTAEQEKGGTSLEAQAEAIAVYCRAQGLLEVAKPLDFNETESGGEESEHKRGEVHRLLANVRRGDMVIVQDVDRFSREVLRAITSQGQVEQGFEHHAAHGGLLECTPRLPSLKVPHAWRTR